MARIETDVLIVGAGPAGASLGCFLTRYGQRHDALHLLVDVETNQHPPDVTGLIISKASSTARTPRAHYTSNATFGVP
ncbi:hypothetical protein F5B17DRAFT_421474 [Nemania serpens]|nr:hypothetical protein F5B17DRAFT_421474 [Nemania serpens]